MSNEQFAPYTRYAEIYDRDQSYFSQATFRYLNRLLPQHGCAKGRALDLACGTGTLALLLAEDGWRVTGVDASADMLEKGRQKAPQVAFYQQDMRELAVPGPFELITCSYDSLNYILDTRDLWRIFERAGQHLVPGGCFYFDLNTLYSLEHVWGNKTEAEDDEEIPYIWETSWDPTHQHSILKATFFVRRGQLYEKFTETHTERAFSDAVVRGGLEQAGFGSVEAYAWDTLNPPGTLTERVAYLARKR